MDIGSLVTQGLIGMQKSQSSMSELAHNIASQGSSMTLPVSDLAESMMNIEMQVQIFDGSAKIVRAADQVIGTLLNISA